MKTVQPVNMYFVVEIEPTKYLLMAYTTTGITGFFANESKRITRQTPSKGGTEDYKRSIRHDMIFIAGIWDEKKNGLIYYGLTWHFYNVLF